MAGEERVGVFTRWFNVDRPWNDRYGAGDFETLDNIREKYGSICDDGYRIVGAECRPNMGIDSEIFTSQQDISTNDVLATYCTKEGGLVCKNEDQLPGQMCQDYSIRFKCLLPGEEETYNNLFPEFDARIYLVLAIIPILIFLIRLLWVFIFRRRRQQRRRRRREQRRRRGEARHGEEDGDDDNDDDDASINSELARPPPSYQDLFNGDTPSVFAISGGRLTACPKCKDAQCSVVKAGGDNSRQIQQAVTSSGPTPQTPPPNLVQSSPLPSTTTSSSDPSMVENQNEQNRESSNAETGNSEGSTENIRMGPLGNSPHPPSELHIESETARENQTATQGLEPTAPESTSANTDNNDSSNPVILSVPNDSNHTVDIPADVPSPCACACHRAIPFGGREVLGYDNVGFTQDSDTPSPSNGPAPYRGRHIPAIPRPHSSVSIVSQITLSELPSYEDALELEKKMAAGLSKK